MKTVFRKHGFTLIEMIMIIVLLGIVMIPLGIMSMKYVEGIVYSRDLGVAEGLAKTEMAKINNLAYDDATLADAYDITTSNYEGYGPDLRREVSYVAGSDDNLKKVVVTLYESGTSTQLAKVVSYVADVSFGAGSGGGAVTSESEADLLAISSGSISAKVLRNIDMENTSTTDAITISKVRVSWTDSNPSKPASLTTIEMDGSTRWSRLESTSGTTVTLSAPFTLAAATSYNNTGEFTFSENISSVTLTFIMSDNSSTAAITW